MWSRSHHGPPPRTSFETTCSLPQTPSKHSRRPKSLLSGSVSQKCGGFGYLQKCRYTFCRDLNDLDRFMLLTPQFPRTRYSFSSSNLSKRYGCVHGSIRQIERYSHCSQAVLNPLRYGETAATPENISSPIFLRLASTVSSSSLNSALPRHSREFL